MSSPKAQTKSKSVLDELTKVMDEQKHSYACGGRIPIASRTIESEGEADASPTSDEQPRQSDPVTLRWDVNGFSIADKSPCRKVTFPATQPADCDALNALIQDCQPATFGLDGQDVYDETYRKALKMNPDAFSSTFDPYSLGIVDSIAQMLLPTFSESTSHRAVEARLYKLNVYSGPSGMFKAHVDTPRSSMQFGSLVVCLPVEHQGGQLKVRHKGKETTFDWSMLANHGKTPHIEWAAFYSDCEHEIMEVTSGNRLTLTYNLFAVRGAGRLTGKSLTLDPTRLPLYHAIERMVSRDPFSGKGGTLGFWCSHAYAYNHEKEAPLPETLKGIDAAVWESFKALGIDVRIAPVVKMDADVRGQYEDDSDDGKGPGNGPPSEYIIGDKFGVKLDRRLEVESAEEYDELFTEWGSYSDDPIHWLTKPKHSEMQIIYTAYGNQASAAAMYSSCAVLATLPSKDSLSTK